MISFPHTSVAVVGAGIVGLSVTASLLERGIKARCFETAKAGGAQSGGGSRILRTAYDDPEMLAFARRAVEGWSRWQEEFGAPLVEQDGSILMVDDCEKELIRLQNGGVDAVLLNFPEQHRLLPIRVPWDRPVILERNAGTVHAADTVGWLKKRCAGHLHEDSEVIGLTEREDHVLVTTRTAIWRAERVLVCAGALTPTIARWFGATVRQVHSVHQRVLLKIRPEFRKLPLPSFRDKTDHRDGVLYVYGLRALHDDRYAVGLEPTDLEREGGGHPDVVVAHTLDFARELLPGLDPDDFVIDSCVSTALAPPDPGLPWESERLVVERHGRCDFFAGGHLFKFAPALGESLAEVAMGNPVPPIFLPQIAG